MLSLFLLRKFHRFQQFPILVEIHKIGSFSAVDIFRFRDERNRANGAQRDHRGNERKYEIVAGGNVAQCERVNGDEPDFGPD